MAPVATNKQQCGELRILCIDGGGIRGLIPAVILNYLEDELRKIDGSTARLADYFDCIVGTSTGALIGTMLAVPKKKNHPLYTAEEIINLYKDEGPKIFRNDKKATWDQVAREAVLLYIKYYNGSNPALQFLNKMFPFGSAIGLDKKLFRYKGPAANNGVMPNEEAPAVVMEDYIGAILQELCRSADLAERLREALLNPEVIKALAEGLREALLNPDFIRYALLRPKYDAEGLREVVERKLGSHRLHETVTNVVVPTFDIKDNQPVVFSTSKAKQDRAVMDHSLSDICIAATAAPTFFPAHKITGSSLPFANPKEFNLIDAGVFANNPTTEAINEVWRMNDRGELPVHVSAMDCSKLCILSIGTGVVKSSYPVDECNWWGALPWLYNIRKKTQPLIDTLMYSTGSLVDYNVALLFKSHGCEGNYLRIQENDLKAALGAMDDDLKAALGTMDDTSEVNLNNLIQIGKNLLKRQVYRTDCETRKYQPLKDAGKNKDALTKLAHRLVAEKHRRLATNVAEPRPNSKL